jgi:hypothetical protein
VLACEIRRTTPSRHRALHGYRVGLRKIGWLRGGPSAITGIVEAAPCRAFSQGRAVTLAKPASTDRYRTAPWLTTHALAIACQALAHRGPLRPEFAIVRTARSMRTGMKFSHRLQPLAL